MIGIHNMQLPVSNEMKPIKPGPLFCVLALPQFGPGIHSPDFALVGAVAPQ
jgi:hypothetical protein